MKNRSSPHEKQDRIWSAAETAPKFAVDLNLGKLAKWLRLLGLDTISLSKIDDQTLVFLKKEKRILLTRNRHIGKSISRGVLLEANDTDTQLKHLFGCLDVKLNPQQLFSRCTLCNTVVNPVEKNVIRGKVPDYIWEIHDRFSKCPSCERIYWRGSHPERFKKRLDTLLGQKIPSC